MGLGEVDWLIGGYSFPTVELVDFYRATIYFLKKSIGIHSLVGNATVIALFAAIGSSRHVLVLAGLLFYFNMVRMSGR
ncbi:hypothetical protein KSP40_PGU017317 [Platanthera guangdongensis]|uniref:Uncharacterized protein n=1 Tax=Platanthera guangdongensis TaxID=2320717 RepID=A0ABR2MNG8_9ASPA